MECKKCSISIPDGMGNAHCGESVLDGLGFVPGERCPVEMIKRQIVAIKNLGSIFRCDIQDDDLGAFLKFRLRIEGKEFNCTEGISKTEMKYLHWNQMTKNVYQQIKNSLHQIHELANGELK